MKQHQNDLDNKTKKLNNFNAFSILTLIAIGTAMAMIGRYLFFLIKHGYVVW